MYRMKVEVQNVENTTNINNCLTNAELIDTFQTFYAKLLAELKLAPKLNWYGYDALISHLSRELGYRDVSEGLVRVELLRLLRAILYSLWELFPNLNLGIAEAKEIQNYNMVAVEAYFNSKRTDSILAKQCVTKEFLEKELENLTNYVIDAIKHLLELSKNSLISQPNPNILLNIRSHLERQWKEKKFLPFFHKYKHLMKYTYPASKNPHLLDYFVSLVKELKDFDIELGANPGITFDLIKEIKDKAILRPSYAILRPSSYSCNPGIKMQDIINHPDFDWDWKYVSANPNLTINMIEQFPNKDWNWRFVSRNPGITVQEIIDRPLFPWSWSDVSANPNLTMYLVDKYKTKKWNWQHVSQNPGITMDDIKSRSRYSWVWKRGISLHPNLNMDMINTNKSKKWDFPNVSYSAGITMNDIIENPKCEWDYDSICTNPNMNMQMIKLHPEWKTNPSWFWYNISENPGITMQDIINHPAYPWEWNNVFANKFSLDKQLYVNNQLGRVLLVSILDEYDTDTSNQLESVLLVLYNDYHLQQIFPYL